MTRKKKELVDGFISIIKPKINLYEIQLNSIGGNVRFLQEILIKKGYDLKKDGIFSLEIENIIKDIQKENNFNIDGKVDSKLWEILLK